MLRLVSILMAAICLPAVAHAQDAYAAILLQYLSGDADRAVAQVVQLPRSEIEAGFDAFETTRAQLILTGAAALHTEAALRAATGPDIDYHLDIATAIVEFGERPGLKTNTTMILRPQYAVPVPDRFRRLWYCAVISGLEGAALLKRADKYISHALALYPEHEELLLLAGIADEMHASPRVQAVTDGDRRHALDDAEKRYRLVVTRQPSRLEARLRLAHVLQQRDRLAEARVLLTPLTTAEDNRLAYLASLFLGGIEDRDHHAAEAAALYDRAAARVPAAQTARLAASELRHRSGDRQAAADAVSSAAGDKNDFDPWWTYIFGEYWRLDVLVDALRKERHG